MNKTTSIKERLDHLVDLQPGTVWTEYHWRDVLQLKQELMEVVPELQNEVPPWLKNGH